MNINKLKYGHTGVKEDKEEHGHSSRPTDVDNTKRIRNVVLPNKHLTIDEVLLICK